MAFERVVLAVTSGLALMPAGAIAQGVPGQRQVLSLAEAVRIALRDNPTLAASGEALDAAEARVGMARSGFLPSAVVTASYRRATQNSASPPWISISADSPSTLRSAFARDPSMTSYDNLAAGVTVSQTIWDFGRTLGSYRSARASRDASAGDLAAAADAVRLDVISAYYGVLAAEASRAAAEEVLRQMTHHLELARAQVAVGVRQRIDVTRAESDVASANLDLLHARNGVRLARLRLLAAMGVDGPQEFEVAKPPPPRDPEPEATDLAVARAIERRPEYRAARERVAAAEGAIVSARSAWYPTLAAGASWSHAGYRFSDLPYNWAIGVTATWAAFSGLHTVNATREAEANRRAAVAMVRALDVGIRTEVESARLAYEEARERLPAARALVASATETLALAEGRYEAGTGNIVEVADAQAVSSQARTALIQAEYDFEVARAVLLKATGDLAHAYGE